MSGVRITQLNIRLTAGPLANFAHIRLDMPTEGMLSIYQIRDHYSVCTPGVIDNMIESVEV